MKKISLSLSGHQTSVSLEPEFVDALRDVAKKEGRSPSSIIADIDSNRDTNANLSSAVRIWILKYFKN